MINVVKNTELSKVVAMVAEDKKRAKENDMKRTTYRPETMRAAVEYIERVGISAKKIAYYTSVSPGSISRWIQIYGTRGNVPEQKEPAPVQKPAPKSNKIEIEVNGVSIKVEHKDLKTLLEGLK